MQSQSLKTPSKGANQPCSRKWALSSAKKALDSGKRVLYSATKNSASLQKSSICVLLHAVAIAEDSKHKVQKSPLPCESALFFAKKSLDSGKIALFSGPRFRQKSPIFRRASPQKSFIFITLLAVAIAEDSFWAQVANKPHFLSTKPCTSAKEPYILQKSPVFLKKSPISPPKRALFPQKSFSMFPQKSPMLNARHTHRCCKLFGLYSRATTRALYFCVSCVKHMALLRNSRGGFFAETYKGSFVES